VHANAALERTSDDAEGHYFHLTPRNVLGSRAVFEVVEVETCFFLVYEQVALPLSASFPTFHALALAPRRKLPIWPYSPEEQALYRYLFSNRLPIPQL